MRCGICRTQLAPWERERITREISAAGLDEADASIVHKRCYLRRREPYTFHATWAPITSVALDLL